MSLIVAAVLIFASPYGHEFKWMLGGSLLFAVSFVVLEKVYHFHPGPPSRNGR